eukprot:7385605-Prymnesium_polylepis.1
MSETKNVFVPKEMPKMLLQQLQSAGCSKELKYEGADMGHSELRVSLRGSATAALSSRVPGAVSAYAVSVRSLITNSASSSPPSRAAGSLCPA